jgi:putative FmdB family regulatory protein
MPTYEYQCKSCDHRFEIWQKMADEPLTICPQCAGTIRRVLFPAGIVFKGSGFYKTDHGSSAPASDKNQITDNKSKESTPKQEDTAGEKKAEKAASPAASEKTAVAAD